jgi:acyl-CoA thioester hydrolase
MAGTIGRPELGGRQTAEGHVLRVRVYYEDTDFSGLVYHGSYVRFLERGRSDFLRLCGVEHARLAADGLHFAVSTMSLSFMRAAKIDDIVEVTTRVEKLTGARVVLAQAIRRGDDQLVAAEVTVAMIDGNGRPRRFPDGVRDTLSGSQS